MRIKYRKNKKTVVRKYNVYDQNAEAGDIMINDFWGTIYRLYTPTSWRSAISGHLLVREIKPPNKRLHAIWAEDGEIYWTDEPLYADLCRTK